MTNVAIIFGLLVAPALVAYLFHLNVTMGGRVGIGVVFLFTAIGHFFKTEAMSAMLPPFMPARRGLIYVSGVVEVLFAIAAVALPNLRSVGWCIIIYLMAIFPSNIYAAVQRIPFGGHSIGPRYLLVRLPLQVLLIGWTYSFAVKGL